MCLWSTRIEKLLKQGFAPARLAFILNLQVFGSSTMRPLASLIVALLCMFASKVATETFGEMLHVVDYRTLKTCYSERVSNLAPA